MTDKFHRFKQPTEAVSLPGKFTYPFHYTPHPICIQAAREVQDYLSSQDKWQEELKKGKMFGVLTVRNTDGELGFLAAFSGLLAGSNTQDYFVPPIYDLQRPDGFFKAEEANISEINKRISDIEGCSDYQASVQELQEEESIAKLAIGMAKMQLQQNKMMRDEKRKGHPSAEDEAAMIHESQFQKAELKRLKAYHAQQISSAKAEVEKWENKLSALKEERKQRSANLQMQLFEQFQLLNANGESKSLCSVFENTAGHIPPAGAGECAAPRLLQYAYLHHMQPIAMAEFWWGDSPKTEIRRHGYFYPSCHSKCEPILKHMLQGLDVEENPLLHLQSSHPIEILWEDEWIVVINKPEGMLTVPGKSDLPSVEEWLRMRYPNADGPMIVHRLDMATSGVLLAAKNKQVHEKLQQQFKNHQIEKKYIALLDGILMKDSGIIDLPICPNPDDRPRQTVSFEYGKCAISKYEVLSRTQQYTRVAFYPLTGRTHQLRVHAAHPDGLNMPILGDELYGRKDKRLFLHAESIRFTHPVSHKMIYVEKKADF